MINLAVFNLKDIGKYLLKISIVLISLWMISCFFSNNSKENDINLSSLVKKDSLIGCIDEVIPGIRQLNKKDIYEFEETDMDEFDILKLLLKVQIGMIDNIKTKEETDKIIEENNVQYNVEQAQTRFRNSSYRKQCTK